MIRRGSAPAPTRRSFAMGEACPFGSYPHSHPTDLSYELCGLFEAGLRLPDDHLGWEIHPGELRTTDAH